MTGTHSLQGLMKWLTRDEWCDRFAEVYDDHLPRPVTRSISMSTRLSQ